MCKESCGKKRFTKPMASSDVTYSGDELLTVDLTKPQRRLIAELIPEIRAAMRLHITGKCKLSVTAAQLAFIRDVVAIRGKLAVGQQVRTLDAILANTPEVPLNLAAPSATCLHVTVSGSDPVIWRLFEFDDCPLSTVHDCIQISMGWSGDQIHRFRVDGRVYGPGNDVGSHDFREAEFDDSKCLLSDILRPKKPGFTFECVYGNSLAWDLRIEFLGYCFRAWEGKTARCADGLMAGPPEEYGGMEEFRSLSAAANDRRHPDNEKARRKWNAYLKDGFDSASVSRRIR